MSNSAFIDTQQYKLFSEFCDACASYRYIGLCYGPPGVGKTLSAKRYSDWERFSKTQFFISGTVHHEYMRSDKSVNVTTAFYTPSVSINARTLYREIQVIRERIRVSSGKMNAVNRNGEKLLSNTIQKRKRERQEYEIAQDGLVRGLDHHPSCAAYETAPTVYDVQIESARHRKHVNDPTKLIIIDETERLSAASLEQVRHIYDEGGVGIILIGMPGLEKRLARYAQLSSRIGFVHKYNPLKAEQIRDIWKDICPNYLRVQNSKINEEALTAIIRMTRGNFRLLERLLSQIERVLEINELSEITLEVVGVARENLVIGNA